MYLKFDKPQEASVALRSSLQENPDDIVAKYFLCIAEGRKPGKILREEYVEKIFDEYSNRFEQDLVDNLGYRIPSIIRETIERLYGNDIKFSNMVDLGCGTGLGGLAFKDCPERLTGIDISARMLEKASEKNIYDSLVQGELIDVLDNTETSFDFFLAADIFIYFQELDPLFASIKNRSTAGALLAFTTESNDTEGIVIRKSGRIAHSPGYIRRITDEFNFKIVMEKRMPIRKDHKQWVEGDLFVCKVH